MFSTRSRDQAQASIAKVSEDALIDEMKGGRKMIFAFLAIGLAVVALIIFLLAR